jgi:hypothetical protein
VTPDNLRLIFLTSRERLPKPSSRAGTDPHALLNLPACLESLPLSYLRSSAIIIVRSAIVNPKKWCKGFKAARISVQMCLSTPLRRACTGHCQTAAATAAQQQQHPQPQHQNIQPTSGSGMKSLTTMSPIAHPEAKREFNIQQSHSSDDQH